MKGPNTNGAVVGFGRQFAFVLVLFILLVIILTGICVI
jgi:uncharacterized protein (TIGR01732 family)